jgi:hypothetical protein
MRVGALELQSFPQFPQSVMLLLRFSSQPFSGTPSQFANPARQVY